MTTITDTPLPETITDIITDTIAPNRLPLHLAHERHGAIMHARDGWTVPAHYGDSLAEYHHVRDGREAGLFDLSTRARLEVSGAEAVQFLNGMITNDIAALETGAWMFAAFPNVQGRLVAMARILCTAPNTFLFDFEPATYETILKNLTRFTFAGDFHLTDHTHDTVCLSIQGAHANEIVNRVLGIEAASLEPYRGGRIAYQELTFTVMRATHTGEDGFDVFIDAASASMLFDKLIDAGAHPAGYDALEILRIEAGIPRHGTDINDTNIVLEAGNEEAVSYTKGCYIGQEIIARIHWRGHVAKQLTGIQLDSTVPLEPDTKLYSAIDDKEAGRITSATVSPTLNRTVAIALVKYSYLAPDTELIIKHDDGTRLPARVVKFPHLPSQS